MIQRLQTVFLFLAIVCIGLFLWLPAIEANNPDNFNHITKGWEVRERLTTGMGVYFFYFNAILLGTAVGISLLSIFLYKWRKLQMVFTLLSIPFIISAIAFTVYHWQNIQSLYINRKLIVLDVYITPFNFFLIAAILFQVLAFMYIRKDEKLIKSLDRLR